MQLERKIFIELYHYGEYKTRRYGPYTEIKFKIKEGTEGGKNMKDKLDTGYVPKPDDVLYFVPGCSVPRFKLKDRFKTTIKPSNATVAFVSSNSETSNENMLCMHRGLNKIDGNKIARFIEYIYGANSNKAMQLKSLMMNYGTEVYMNEDQFYTMQYYSITLPDNSIKVRYHDFASNNFTKENYATMEDKGRLDDGSFSFYYKGSNSKMGELNCPIYHQDEILKYINEQQPVIDQKQYEQLRLMANSSDEENIILVMELMANCDYKKSFIYLLLLLKEFNSDIQARKEFNHVNFKAMLSFLGMDPRRFNYQVEDINHYMLMMKKYKEFTRSNIQRLTQFFTGTKMDNSTWTFGPILKKDAEDQLDDENENSVEFINNQTV
jgi:hypothetical protein